MIQIRQPNITAGTPEEKVEQLHRYIIQLVRQLNWAFAQLEGDQNQDEGGNTNA